MTKLVELGKAYKIFSQTYPNWGIGFKQVDDDNFQCILREGGKEVQAFFIKEAKDKGVKIVPVDMEDRAFSIHVHPEKLVFLEKDEFAAVFTMKVDHFAKDTYSFEIRSGDKSLQNNFLRYEYYDKIKLSANDGSESFKSDASFILKEAHHG